MIKKSDKYCIIFILKQIWVILDLPDGSESLHWIVLLLLNQTMWRILFLIFTCDIICCKSSSFQLLILLLKISCWDSFASCGLDLPSSPPPFIFFFAIPYIRSSCHSCILQDSLPSNGHSEYYLLFCMVLGSIVMIFSGFRVQMSFHY